MKKLFWFFLGGYDTEMVRILEVLVAENQKFTDKKLSWGAKASHYGDEIVAVAKAGFTPVLVELESDCDLPEGTVVVDHHGTRSGEPASIMQVLHLLGCAPTRWDEVVAANDSGWWPGLIAIGATAEEMKKVRGGDRSAQGISPEMEAEAERALAAPVKKIGGVRVIRMSHSKTAPVGDRLAIAAIAAGEAIPQFIVFSGDGEVNFSGRGDIAQALHEKFQGWSGGSGLGKADGTAFWGGYLNHEEVEEFLHCLVE